MVGGIFVKKIDFSPGYEPDCSRMKGLAKSPLDVKIVANIMTFFVIFDNFSVFPNII